MRGRQTVSALFFSGAILCAAFSHAAEESGMGLPPAPPIPEIKSLLIEPPTLSILDAHDQRRALVIGLTQTGARIDLTASAQFKAEGGIVTVAPDGYFVPQKAGKTEVAVSAAGKHAKLPVTVVSADVPKVRYVRDIMPIFAKAGCNAGVCHGAAQGKNGFKMSLRGYDPEYDYNVLVNDISGRRINRVAPEQSLMLLKPTAEVPHEGKQAIKPGSPYYQMILQWIAEGATSESIAAGRASSLELLPEKAEFDLPGRTQQILVVAHYADGTTRDVTREAVFSTSNKDVAVVTNGLVTAVRRGESAILVRYEGNYASKNVSVMGDRSGFAWQDVPTNNFIDTHVIAKLQNRKIQPSELCTDADFIRRVSLDLTGQPPTAERARAFVTDPTPTKEKREKLIDALIGNPEFVEYWSSRWADLLQCNSKSLGEKGVWVFRDWLRYVVDQNTPYDKFVRELITAKGSCFQNPATNYLRVLREPGKMTEDISQTFLGTRFNCNKCHDHPFERWTQNQYYEFGAFFARVQFKKGKLPEEEIVYRSLRNGEVKSPRTDKEVVPKVPFGTSAAPAADDDRREPFIEWMVSKDNPLFAKSAANRIWSYFFGLGIIDPVDDILAGNPPSNPELLDALTEDFVKSGFDLRHLMRTICSSRTYQLSVASNKWNEDDKSNFSHALPRRLSAEQMLDAVAVATGVRPKFNGMPDGMRAVSLADGMIKGNDFLTLFGRPERQSSCECERTTNISLSHTLNLINGAMIGDALIAPASKLDKYVKTETDNKKVVEEIYYAVLNRPPTEKEQQDVDLGSGAQRAEVAQDLAWALMNSPAFIFNR